MTEVKIGIETVKEGFQKACTRRFGRKVDFTPLEEELGRLKKGGSLTYGHLEKIANGQIWPFSDFWRWPVREQIEEELRSTEGLFKRLDGLRSEYGETEEEEKPFVKHLYDIFKNLELVSIVLRFVDPENYGILSPPITKILNCPRGDDYATEYTNYLKELRKYRDIYQLERVAYADMFLWAIAELEDQRDGLLQFFHRSVEESNRKKIVREIIGRDILGRPPIEKAKFYLEKVEDYNTAAMWAGYAFVNLFEEKCLKNAISLWHKNSEGREERKKIPELIKELCHRLDKDSKDLLDVTNLRNKSAHSTPGKPFDDFFPSDVRFMINTIKEFQKW